MLKFLYAGLFAVSVLHGTTHYISEESQLSDDPREQYIDLVKRVVANTIYPDAAFGGRAADYRNVPYDPVQRESGLDHPLQAHTMIGLKRLNNIHDCMKEVLKNQVEGDFIETGVWRGGATILMRAILKAYGDTHRKVWVADSFAGLPPPNIEKYPADEGLNLCDVDYLSVSLDQVKSNFQKYGLLDRQVVFLEGFFEDTLANAPIDKIAVLRMDGDLYQSTMETLTALYPKVSVGGYVIVDDYEIEACRKAITDFRRDYGVFEPMHSIDINAVYWQKLQ